MDRDEKKSPMPPPPYVLDAARELDGGIITAMRPQTVHDFFKATEDRSVDFRDAVPDGCDEVWKSIFTDNTNKITITFEKVPRPRKGRPGRRPPKRCTATRASLP